MLTLRNAELEVQLLDPRSPATRALQGTRYCWGGYVWQVRDRVGDLLSGPEYPEPQPVPFNGQGLPESFRLHDRASGRLLTGEGHDGFVIGAGRVTLGAKGSLGLVEAAAWSVEVAETRATFRTAQEFGAWRVELEREIRLEGRTLTSSSRLTHRGRAVLPLQWFPHPFWQLTDGRIRGTLPPGFSVAPNPAFTLQDGKFEMVRAFAKGGGGHFQLLEPAPVPIEATFTHPRLRQVRMTVDYVASEIPVWANHHTFSIEPYLQADVAPGETRQWSVRYAFVA